MSLTKLGHIVNQNPQTKNALINGDFRIWQRGSSFTGGSQFTADRWLMAPSGGDTIVVDKIPNTVGWLASGHSPVNVLRINVTANGGAYTDFVQYIEDVRSFIGQTVTFSAWVYVVNACDIAMYAAQIFGTGGSTPNVIVKYEDHSVVAGSWYRLSTVMDVPSITGKTIGTNDSLAVALRIPGNATNSIYFSNVQFELGDVATDFELRHRSAELAMCQRYYEVGTQTLQTGVAYTATNAYGPFHWFRVEKRAAPTVNFVKYQAYDSTGSWYNVTSPAATPRTWGFGTSYGGTGMVAWNGSLIWTEWTADAEL